jgi:hypothetical protein
MRVNLRVSMTLETTTYVGNIRGSCGSYVFVRVHRLVDHVFREKAETTSGRACVKKQQTPWLSAQA